MLGLTTAILLVAGNIIGTGVFKKIVPMAATGLSENYILGAWILAGIVTMLGAFSIAGLAKLTTEAGGNFEYLRLCYGDFLSFLFGWAYFMILGSGSIAAVSFIFSQSFNALFQLPDPLAHLQNISIGAIQPFADSGIKLLAIAAIVLLTWYNYRGVKKGTTLNNFMTTAKIAGILLLIVLGFFFSQSAAYTSVAVVEAPLKNMSNLSWLAIFFGVMLNAFWSYDGFSNVAAASAEIKNPKRNIPIAIITGVSIVLVLYVLINYAFMKAMPLHDLASIPENQVAAIVVANSIIGNTGTIMISILLLLSTFGYLNVAVLLFSRYYYRMAQEQLFFKHVAKIHPVYKTPYIALIYSMIWSCVLVLSGSFDVLTDMAVFGAFAFYVLLAIGLIKMKKKGLIKEKIPGYPYAPILFSLFIIAVLTSTFINNPVRTITGIALILSGVPFYFYFKSQKKKQEAFIG
ncbi:MAG: amino acid permease [Ginsengibacter sp.]